MTDLITWALAIVAYIAGWFAATVVMMRAYAARGRCGHRHGISPHYCAAAHGPKCWTHGWIDLEAAGKASIVALAWPIAALPAAAYLVARRSKQTRLLTPDALAKLEREAGL